MTTQHTDVLRRPGARSLYRELRRKKWLAPFLESPDRVHRRLGAMLVVDELLEKLDPERASAGALRNGVEARAAQRVEGRKRAAAMYMAGFTFADIARELGIKESKAAQWARHGRTT